MLLLGACDQVVYFQPEIPAESQTINELRQNEVDTIVHSFEAHLGDTVVIPDSLDNLNTILVLPPDLCVYSDGELCTGEVEVTFVEIYGKNQMIYSGIPTTSAPQLLESGGEFFLSLTQDGSPVFIREGNLFYIKAPKEKSESSNEDMAFYVEETPGATPFNWIYQGELYDQSEDYYTIAYDQLERWMNIDVPVTSAENTAVTISVWSDDTITNATEVFLVSQSINAMIEVIPPINSGPYFIDNLPSEMEFTVIAIQENKGTWRMAMQELTAGSNLEIDLKMEEINYSALKAEIDALD